MKSIFIALLVFIFCGSGFVMASDDPFHTTPYPLPRFVSLAKSEINVRTGPGNKYPIKWVYTQKSRPVEIILEFDNWRKIRDIDGGTGWVHGSLVSGRRSGIVISPKYTVMRKKPKETSRAIVKLQEGMIVRVSECESEWCRAHIGDFKGWVKRKSIWGVYARENFD